MNKNLIQNPIGLFELAKILWAGRAIISLSTIISGTVSVLFALSLQNIFRAEAVLMPLEDQRYNRIESQLGLATNIAGINLFDRGSNQTQVAIATLQSRDFVSEFISSYELLPYLFASEYDAGLRSSVLNADIYDSESKTWIADNSDDDPKPSDWDAYNTFSAIMQVSHDVDTGLVSLSIEWPDPILASQWVNLLIQQINEHLRNKDATEATKAISFLEEQIQSTQLIEMQRTIYQIIESQTRTLMLTEVREEYAFQTIDPAVVPEDKVRPRRSLICILGTLLGIMLASTYVVASQIYSLRSS